MISVIIVQHNNAHLTLQAVRTLQQYHRDGYEIIVVDNASTDGSLESLKRQCKGATIIENAKNIGFGAANNRAASVAKGDLFLFLNNDTICSGEYLHTVEALFMADPGVGIIGPRLLNDDGAFQLSAGWLPSFWREIAEKILYAALRRNVRFVHSRAKAFFSNTREVGWVTGAALFIRKALYEQIGRFDEAMFMYFEDKDICARSWGAGKKVMYEPRVAIVHLKGGSSPESLSPFLRNVYRNSQRRYYTLHRPRYEQLLLTLYLRLIRETPNG